MIRVHHGFLHFPHGLSQSVSLVISPVTTQSSSPGRLLRVWQCPAPEKIPTILSLMLSGVCIVCSNVNAQHAPVMSVIHREPVLRVPVLTARQSWKRRSYPACKKYRIYHRGGGVEALPLSEEVRAAPTALASANRVVSSLDVRRTGISFAGELSTGDAELATFFVRSKIDFGFSLTSVQYSAGNHPFCDESDALYPPYHPLTASTNLSTEYSTRTHG